MNPFALCVMIYFLDYKVVVISLKYNVIGIEEMEFNDLYSYANFYYELNLSFLGKETKR